ncbi:MAG: hypothetical protein Q9227_003892 [Pyrenula ochraceoflavens]
MKSDREAPLAAEFISAGCILRLATHIGTKEDICSFSGQPCVVIRGPSGCADDVKICMVSWSSSATIRHLVDVSASPFECIPILSAREESPPPMHLRLLHNRNLPGPETFYAVTQLVCKVPVSLLGLFHPSLPVHHFKLDASSLRRLSAAFYLMPAQPSTPNVPNPTWKSMPSNDSAASGSQSHPFEKQLEDIRTHISWDSEREQLPTYTPVPEGQRSRSLASRVLAKFSLIRE